MLVTMANRDDSDVDSSTLIRSKSDGFEGVQFRPARLVKRQIAVWRGLSGEVIRIGGEASFESDYQGPCHLLVLYTQVVRNRGHTIVEGLPRSTLHDLSNKLTFVPAGRRFQESQEPRAFTRASYFH